MKHPVRCLRPLEPFRATRSLTLASLLIFPGLLPLNLAWSEEGARLIEEIVVTARKREENLQSVPLVIDVVPGDLIAAGGINTVEDIEYAVPGLTIGNRGFNGAFLGLRGISSIRSFVGDEAAVAVHLDGVFLPQSPQAFSSLYDIERVEVLKGPQGTEYGRNATAGVINVISRSPDLDGNSGRFEVSYGSHNAVQVEGVGNFVTGERSAVRVAVASRNSDGFITNALDGDEVGGEDYWGARISYRAELSDTLELLFKYQHAQNDQPQVKVPTVPPNGRQAAAGYGALAEAGANDFYDTIINTPISRDRQDDNVMLQLDWDMGSFGIRSITGYTSFDNELVLDFTLEPFTTGNHMTDGQSPNTNEGDSISQEFQLYATDPDALDWRFGLYYIRTEAEETRFASNGGVFGTASIFAFQGYYDDFFLTQDGTAYSAFGEVAFDLSPDVTLSVGLRYTEEDKDQTQREWAGADVPTLCGGGPIGFAWCGEARLYHATAEREWDDFSGRVSLEWQMDENILAYGSVATGFRSGAIGGVIGFNNFGADGGWLFNGSGVYRGPEGTIGLKPFEPETVTNYEIGMKSTLADGRVQLNATLFFSQFEDQLVFAPHPDTPFDVLEGNIGESEAKGLDLSLNWAIDEHWLYVLGAEVSGHGIDRPWRLRRELWGVRRHIFGSGAGTQLRHSHPVFRRGRGFGRRFCPA